MAFTSGNSIADLQTLLKNKSNDMDAFKSAFDAFASHWRLLDRAAFSSAASDWQALQDRYSHAKLIAEGEIALSYLNPMPASTILASSWDDVIAALQKKDGVVSPGDLQDLWIRLQNAQKRPIVAKAMVQPTATDWPLQAYQAADKAVKGIESIPKAAADEIGSHPWFALGAGTIAMIAIGGGLLIFAVPFLLPLLQTQSAVKKLGRGITRTIGMARVNTEFAVPRTERMPPKTVHMRRVDVTQDMPTVHVQPSTKSYSEAEWEPEPETEHDPETERHSKYAPSTIRPRTERAKTLRSIYSSHRTKTTPA
jgi:hypothetical protein